MAKHIANTPALNIGLKVLGLVVAVQLIIGTSPTVV